MAKNPAAAPGGGTAPPQEADARATPTQAGAAISAASVGDPHGASEEQARKSVSLPLAAFPVGAIVVVAALGALAGPMWAGTGTAICVTALGMWVARVSQSTKTALLVGVTGLLATAGLVAVSFRASDKIDSRTQDISPNVAYLGGVDLSRADLRRVDLRGADLRAADFTKACLRAADLRGANLHDAIFTGSDVAGSLTDGPKQTTLSRNWPKAAPVPSPCDK